MTEDVWRASSSPSGLLAYVRCSEPVTGSLLRRKLRLFGCACCRLQWPDIPEGVFRQAIEITERHADGMAKPREMQSIHRRCGMSVHEYGHGAFAAERLTSHNTADSVAYALRALHLERGAPESGDDTAQTLQTDLLRDIFGNPFRPVAFDAAWRTETAVGLARGIYEERAFERMPILADALQEVGCEHSDILSHCREPGDHVRGCWVVDLVLGKV